jgi:aminoglycoside phosphotransferase (APT) family kinase protein
LIHGDLRLDNCCTSAGTKQIHIVDWELTGFGDPLWDVGTVFAELASAWIMSAPIPTGCEPADGITHARIPVDSLRFAGREFWHAYLSTSDLKGDRTQALRDAIRYAAARLLQLTYEHLQGCADLTLHGIGHAQLSENLIQRPIDGAAQILGIAA